MWLGRIGTRHTGLKGSSVFGGKHDALEALEDRVGLHTGDGGVVGDGQALGGHPVFQQLQVATCQHYVWQRRVGGRQRHAEACRKQEQERGETKFEGSSR